MQNKNMIMYEISQDNTKWEIAVQENGILKQDISLQKESNK